MIRRLIIDDEEIARQHLARLLSAYPDLVIAGEASNGIEGLQLIADWKLDVRLGNCRVKDLSFVPL